MIENVFTAEFWNESLTADSTTRTLTVYVGNATRQPKVSAQINLARLEGSGTAKAMIWRYTTIEDSLGEVSVGIEPPLADSDPNRLVKGRSTISLSRASSVTFGLTVTNMFAWVNCTVFTYEYESRFSELVSDRVSELIRLLGRP
jgi:hypothetical protein